MQTAYDKVIQAECELLDQHLGSVLSGAYATRQPESIGNFNNRATFEALMPLDLERVTTYRDCIDHLRAMTHPPYWNAFFIDGQGKKVFIRVEMMPDNHS